jgi:1-hydroxycarotenoid 3,4-desaturase
MSSKRCSHEVGNGWQDHVTLHSDTVLARHWWRDGSTLDLHNAPISAPKLYSDFAGTKAESEFRRFSDKARRLFEAFDATGDAGTFAEARLPSTVHVMKTPGLIPSMAPGLTLAQKLRFQFSDPRLQQLFGRYATYVGGSPYLSPAILGLIWHSEARGVWAGRGRDAPSRRRSAPAGGGARRAVPFRREGAAYRDAGWPVFAGVRLADGTRLKADIVLFNGDPKALFDGHLGETAVDAVPGQAVTRGACRPSSGASPPSRTVWSLPITTSFSAPIRRWNSATSPRGGCPLTRRSTSARRTGAGRHDPWVPSASRSS